MTTRPVRTDGSWQPRPVLSAVVRVLAYATPIAAGTLAVRAVAPSMTASMPRLAATALALFLAVAVSLFVSRLSLRLMPLVELLRMTMLLPDQARWRAAPPACARSPSCSRART